MKFKPGDQIKSHAFVRFKTRVGLGNRALTEVADQVTDEVWDQIRDHLWTEL